MIASNHPDSGGIESLEAARCVGPKVEGVILVVEQVYQISTQFLKQKSKVLVPIVPRINTEPLYLING